MRVANNTEWLFFHLWKKNPETMLPCLNLNIAETIIFRWAQPYFWYYTAKDGMIVRKTKEKILMQNIEESFLNGLPKCEVVAKTLTSLEDPALKLQEKIEFEYIPKNDFHDFLFQREKSHNVIIQKFIEPKNGLNALIKVAWTPQFCLFFRKTNVNDINNQKIPILNRLVTFEGLEHLSTSDSISSPILASELEQTCLNIVKHIHSVTSGNVQISKMTLFFKLDDKNRLWLLFCTGLKLREKLQNPSGGISFKRKTERPASPIMVVTTKKDKETTKPKVPVQYLLEDQINEIDDNVCLRCSREDLLYDLKLKHVLDHEEKILKGLRPQDLSRVEEPDMDDIDPFYGGLLAPEKGRANIPSVMKKLYPTLTEERYHKLKKNVSLMNMMVKICESCYLVITENLLANADEKKAKKVQSQLKDNVKKEEDYFGFGGLTTKKQQQQPGFEKTSKVITHQAKSVVEQETGNPGPTESDMTHSKRYSKTDSAQKDEFQSDNKPIKISMFSSAKKVPQHTHTKSAFGGKGNSLPQIGVPETNDFKPVESSPESDFYSKELTQASIRAKSNAPPLRQVRSPYVNDSRQFTFDSRGTRTADTTKQILFPRAPTRDKKSAEMILKNSMSDVWRNRQIQTPHKTNFSSMMSTIKDLKSVLGELL